jgi:hypothetical protein
VQNVFDQTRTLWEVVYIITPKDSFKQLVANLKDTKHLLEPVIWPIGSSERVLWRKEDYDLLAKLTFMLANYRRWHNHPKWEFYPVGEKLFRPELLTAQTFDQWWELKEAHVWLGYEELKKKASIAEVEALPKSGNPKVDAWIDKLVEMTTYLRTHESKEDLPNFLRSEKPSQGDEK